MQLQTRSFLIETFFLRQARSYRNTVYVNLAISINLEDLTDQVSHAKMSYPIETERPQGWMWSRINRKEIQQQRGPLSRRF